MKQLSIKEVAFEAVWRYWGLRRELLSVMLIPIAGFLAIDIGASVLDLSGTPGRYLHWASYLVVSALAAISCHRVLLLGPVSVPKFGVGHLGIRELRFIAATLFLGFLFGLVRLFSETIIRQITGPLHGARYLGYLVEIIVALPPSYLFARLAFMLPSIAIETHLGVPGAWQLSNRNGWRLVLLIIFMPWLVRLLQWNIGTVIPDQTMRTVATTTLYALFLPLEIALLSVSYRHLIK
jgi:hypothetical protein